VCCTTGCLKTNAPARAKSGIEASVTGQAVAAPAVERAPRDDLDPAALRQVEVAARRALTQDRREQQVAA
jgi:hypothetical protein